MDIDFVFGLGAAIAIVAIIARTITGIVNRSLDHHERIRLSKQDRASPGSGGDYARLEERVRVLERIATDKGPDELTHQIEALRDMQEIDRLTDNREKTQ